MQIQHLLAHFVSIIISARNMKPLCGGQLCATVILSSIICAGAAQHPTEAVSQPQHSYLGNPEKTPTCTLQSTSNTNQPGTWLVLHHILGALGCQSLEQTCPLLLQSHRQWPFVHSSREKGACCTGLLQEECSLPGIPRLMPKSLLPPAQEKFPGGKE